MSYRSALNGSATSDMCERQAQARQSNVNDCDAVRSFKRDVTPPLEGRRSPPPQTSQSRYAVNPRFILIVVTVD